MLNVPAVAMLPTRDGIEPLRVELARTRVLLEIRSSDAGPQWMPAAPNEPFDWQRGRPLSGTKRLSFAPREALLTWDGGASMLAERTAEPVALVGVHACDLAATAHQDRFFSDDPWYVRRRSRAFLVGIDCVAACPGGFCRDLDAGPFARGGYDLDLTPLPDGRLVAVPGTQAGRDLLGVVGYPLEVPPPEVVRAYEATRAHAESSFPERPAIARAMARIEARSVPHAEWHALGASCLACTGCTNLCPTCSCFTVVDERAGDSGVRSRVWDSCLLEGFQREASGHTPSPHAGDRVRRFWTHKLESAFVAACGRLGCVGCGRCDVTCPGGIGALSVLSRLGAG